MVLAVSLALVALILTPVAFAGSPWVSPIVLAIGFGGLVLNSPVAGWIGLKVESGREGDAYERGLRYIGKWVLRLAIVLMGLKARTDLIEPELLARVLLVLVVTLPTTFFVAHATAGLLKLRREMADLVAIGTMICGASAINALAPTVFARRRDQGLAVTTIFLFNVVALLALLPVGTALGLDTESAGLWAVPHPVLWTQVNATPPGVARAPRGPRSACDTRASRAARSCCTAPRTRSLRRVPP